MTKHFEEYDYPDPPGKYPDLTIQGWLKRKEEELEDIRRQFESIEASYQEAKRLQREREEHIKAKCVRRRNLPWWKRIFGL